jgi:hypothetical protein
LSLVICVNAFVISVHIELMAAIVSLGCFP